VIRFTSPGATVPIAIDRSFDYRLVPETLTGGPDAATAILSTVALAMVSLATLAQRAASSAAYFA
jgi:hypothetical protein